MKIQLIQTFSLLSGRLVSQSWYLSVDMQLFIVAPALVYLVHRFKKTTIIALLIASLISMAWIVFVHIDIGLANTYVCGHY